MMSEPTPEQRRERALLQIEVYGKLYAWCSRCGTPLMPAEKGPDADDPGYVGFQACCPGAEVTYGEDCN